MFCGNCGSKIDDHAKFCPKCGAPTGAPAPEPARPARPVRPAPETTFQAPPAAPTPSPRRQPSKKKKNVLPGILIGVGALLVIALVFTLIFTASPAGKVGKAVSASLDAYEDVAKSLPTAKVSELLKSAAFTQDLWLELDTMDYDDSFQGMGVTMSASVDLKGRQAAMSVTPAFGSSDLMTLDAVLDDNILEIGCPELLDDRYGVDTTDLGSLSKLMDEEIGDLGFNLFDLAEIYQSFAETQIDVLKDCRGNFTALAKEIELEKDGKSSINVNGEKLSCAHYYVTIPQDALEDCLVTSLEQLGEADFEQLYEELLDTMTLPNELRRELLDELKYLGLDDTLKELKHGVKELLNELGDVELEVYLHKGKVASLYWELNGAEIELYLGGPNDYVDDLTLVLTSVYGDETVITSTGNHSGKGGVFTDETTIELPYDEEYTSEFTYDTKAEFDNLLWEVYDGYETLTVEGTLTDDKYGVILALDTVSVNDDDGDCLFDFAVNWQISDYEAPDKTDAPVMLADLSHSELEDLAADLSENFMGLMVALGEELPDVGFYF